MTTFKCCLLPFCHDHYVFLRSEHICSFQKWFFGFAVACASLKVSFFGSILPAKRLDCYPVCSKMIFDKFCHGDFNVVQTPFSLFFEWIFFHFLQICRAVANFVLSFELKCLFFASHDCHQIFQPNEACGTLKWSFVRVRWNLCESNLGKFNERVDIDKTNQNHRVFAGFGGTPFKTFSFGI
jgi:hypothetical protein